MSCFLDTDTAPSTVLRFFEAKSSRVSFDGEWTTEFDSNGREFRVSKTNGDTLTLVFTGALL